MASGSSQGSAVSSKPWYLTFNEEYKELLIWKSGIRLKLKNGCTGGPVKSVAVRDDRRRIVTVSF